MRLAWRLTLLTAVGAALSAHGVARAQAATPQAAAPRTVSHGLFSDVRIFRPAGTVEQFVLMPTMNAVPDVTEQRRVSAMVSAGAMVAVLPLAPFYRRLEAQDGQCTYPGGAFENLSRHLQAFEQLPTYLTPILVGGEGAAPFAYAMLAQTPPGTFASAISPGFCPKLDLKTPLCATDALRWQAAADGRGVMLAPSTTALPVPWVAIEGNASPPVCPAADAARFVQRVPGAGWAGLPSPAPRVAAAAFDAAYGALAVRQLSLAPPPQQLADLPIVEVPAAATTANAKRFAVLLSGDGGWAGIDKGLAAALAEQGVPVAGFDSLRYFWSARTPEGLAVDLDRVIRFYASRWKRSEVILIGYSQGADVLPFAINRLPTATRARVRLTALLGLGQKAAFEFHLANWIGPSGDRPIAPEARRLLAADTLCLYGEAESDSLCPALAPQHVRAVPLAGGHHFSGEYGALAGRILGVLPP